MSKTGFLQNYVSITSFWAKCGSFNVDTKREMQLFLQCRSTKFRIKVIKWYGPEAQRYARKRFCGKDTNEKIIGVTVQHHEAVA